MMTATCASATLSPIPSLVPVKHARELNHGFRMIPIDELFPNPWAYESDLSWTEYRHNCTNTLPPSS